MSNMCTGPENKKAPGRAPLLRSAGGSGLLLGLALDFAFDRLVGDRGALVGLLAAFAHSVLEAAYGAAEVRAHVAQLLGAENQHHDHKNDQPVPDAERAHKNLLWPPHKHGAERFRPAEVVHMD